MAGPFAKVGGHLRANTTDGSAWATNCPSAKSLTQSGGMTLLSQSPGLKVARYVFPSQTVSASQSAGAAAADTVIGTLAGVHVDVIEGYNEICGNTSDCLSSYIVWTQGFVNEAHARGYKAACFSFGVGTPTNLYNQSGQVQSPNDWDTIAASGLLNPGQCDYVALHEYWDVIVGPADPFTALRHREVHNYLVGIGHGNHPPFLLTEIGYDCIYGHTWPDLGCGSSRCGWISQGLTAQQAADGFLSYDQEIQADSYVAYAYAFTNGGGSDFGCFEIDLLAPYLFTLGGNCGAQGQACCSTGAACNSGLSCQNGSCQPIVINPCGQINCSPGYHCDNGYCICSSDGECQNSLGPTFTCQNGACVQTIQVGCQSGSIICSPASAYTCINDQCVCVSDAGCALAWGAGSTCQDGACVATPTVQGGIDLTTAVVAAVLVGAAVTTAVILTRRVAG